jgi:hypothetical protein
MASCCAWPERHSKRAEGGGGGKSSVVGHGVGMDTRTKQGVAKVARMVSVSINALRLRAEIRVC